MSNIGLSAGTVFSISAGIAATHDAAGFSALTFTEVAEVESLPEIGGTSQEVTFTPLTTAVVLKFKGSFDAGSMAVALGRDSSDAGQAIIKTAAEPTNSAAHSFKIEMVDGTVFYFTALVMGYTTNIGDISSVVKATATLSLTNTVVEV